MFYRRLLSPHFIGGAAYFFWCLLPVHIFCFEPGLCHICFCLAFYFIVGKFPTWQACFVGPVDHICYLRSWYRYGLGIFYTVLSLYHLSVQPFLTIPEFRGKCPMHSVLWWSVSLLFCVVQFQHTCLLNLAFFVVTTCSLIFWLIMIFLIHVLFVQNRYL
jgi:hypothetical protein